MKALLALLLLATPAMAADKGHVGPKTSADTSAAGLVATFEWTLTMLLSDGSTAILNFSQESYCNTALLLAKGVDAPNVPKLVMGYCTENSPT